MTIEGFNINDIDSDEYDAEGIACDIRNGNFSEEDLEDYRYENQVRASFVNGQFTQARQQCRSAGLNYELELYKFNHS